MGYEMDNIYKPIYRTDDKCLAAYDQYLISNRRKNRRRNNVKPFNVSLKSEKKQKKTIRPEIKITKKIVEISFD